LDKCYSTDLFTARAKQWIVEHRDTAPTEPFFLYLSYTAPHAALQVPTQAYPAGSGLNGGLQWTGTPGAIINTASGTRDSWVHPDYSSQAGWSNANKRHATMVRRLDDAVGDLLDLLDDLGIGDDTMVVFTSDNGPHAEGSWTGVVQDPKFFRSSAVLDGIKRDTWEAGVRVPTLVRWPASVPAGSTSGHASQFHDWMATFAEMAGVAAPARSDGVSLIPALTGNGTQRDGTVYLEYSVGGSTPGYTDFEAAHRGTSWNQQQVIHLGGYKGIRHNTTSHAVDFKIYNVANDPKETTDLAGQAGVPSQQEFRDAVLRVRRPNSSAPRAYDSEVVPALPLAANEPGLNWRSFESAFPWVPDFSGVTPLASGKSASPDLSVRSRDADIGLEFSGYLEVPTTGDYTFYLSTDTGAFLRLHQMQLIDADFGYTAGSERSATVKLEAGLHPYTLGYRRGTAGTPALELSWSGPSIAKQPIPVSAFVASAAAAGPEPSHWSLEEGIGTSTSEVGSGTASDAFGTGVAWSLDTPGPGSSSSLSFPGTSVGNFGTNLSAADIGIDGSGAKTITAWIRSTYSGNEQMFFGWTPSNGLTAGQDIRLGLARNGLLRLEVTSGFARYDTTPLNDGP
ncbi:MAG: sulfatase-like hydrolase/transferase, partial [Luteolibacter sp.]